MPLPAGLGFASPASAFWRRTALGVGPQLAGDVSGEAQRFLVQALADEVLQAGQDLDDVLEAVIANTFDALAAYLRQGIEAHTDPVARLRGACHAYVAFGKERPEQYAILFTRKVELSPDIDSMLGAEAFAFLLDAIRECAIAGKSHSTKPIDDATALWVALHGYVSLRAAIPDYPWPPDDIVLDDLIDRVALLT
jgi:AcrR family transcriptional regulator